MQDARLAFDTLGDVGTKRKGTMAQPKVSVQFWPWHDLGEMRSYGHKALEAYPFDYIWSADEFLYEDAITLLGVLALELDTSVGTLVTFPWRNPIELAQRFASMAKLSRPGRGVALGIGAGGAVQMKAIREKTNPIAVVRESLIMLRGLLGGGEVDLADFPLLAERFRGNTEMHASLHFPPPTRVPVYLAAARSPDGQARRPARRRCRFQPAVDPDIQPGRQARPPDRPRPGRRRSPSSVWRRAAL